MSERVFYASLDDFRITHTVRKPESVFLFDGYIARDSAEYRSQLVLESAKIFEQLLIFDKLNFKVVGPNVVAPLLRSLMGPMEFDGLLEHGAIEFTVWDQFNTVLHTRDGDGILWGGYLGPGGDPEPDKLLAEGFAAFDGGLTQKLINSLTKKLIPCHRVLPRSLSAEASEVTTAALKDGRLDHYGFSEKERLEGKVSLKNMGVLQQCADDLLEYRYLVSEGLTSLSEYKFFYPFRSSVQKIIKSQANVDAFRELARVQEIPNGQALFKELRRPFRDVLKLRSKAETGEQFRQWLAEASSTRETHQIVRAFIDAIKRKPSHFDNAPLHYLKTIVMSGISLVGSHILGDAVLASMASDFVLDALDRTVMGKIRPGFSPHVFFDDLSAFERVKGTETIPPS